MKQLTPCGKVARKLLVAGLCVLMTGCGGAGSPVTTTPAFPSNGNSGPSDAELRQLAEQKLGELFKQFDKNQDGQIDADEATLTTGELGEIDANHDQKLSREEVLNFLVKQTRNAIPGFGFAPPAPAPAPPIPGAGDEPMTAANVRLMVDADEIYPRVYEVLRTAKKSIQLDLYLLGGAIGRSIAQYLIERQRAGVDVRVMIDPNIGFSGPTQDGMVSVINYLRENQIPFKTYPLQYMPRARGALSNKFQIDHNKIMVIDRTKLIIGGMNMFDGALPNHDIHFEIDGSIAERVGKLLDEQWGLPNNPYQAPPSPRPLRVAGMGPLNARVRFTRTDVDIASTKPILLHRIKNAKRSIDMAMFELSDRDVIREIRFASARGVAVRAILDEHADVDKYTNLPVPAGMPNLLPVRDFLAGKVPVRWWRPARHGQELHMKLIIFDNEVVIAGSTNFTTQALSSFREAGVELESPEIASYLTRMFEQDWNTHTKPITKLTFSQELVANTIQVLDDSYMGWW